MSAEMTRPGASVLAVSKSDTVDIATLNGLYPRALYVGVSGNVVIVTPDGKTATLLSVPIGILPVQFKRINSTSTTATDMVAIY